MPSFFAYGFGLGTHMGTTFSKNQKVRKIRKKKKHTSQTNQNSKNELGASGWRGSIRLVKAVLQKLARARLN